MPWIGEAPTAEPPLAAGGTVKVSVQVSRLDVAIAGVVSVFSSTQLVIVMLILAAVGAIPSADGFAMWMLFTATLIALGMFGGAVFSIGNALFNPRLHFGVLGRHDFELRELGLYEKTAHNESLHNWQSIDKMVDVLGLVMLRVAGSSWHILPNRSFSGAAQKQAFLDALRSRVTNSQRNP